MNDSDRLYPVSFFFLHHSTGPDFVNADDLTVQDWYSDTGKARAYSNGAIDPRHEHPSRPNQKTYAQAQFTLREYNIDGNKYGWRLTDLIQRPWQNVTWSVGNWDYNRKSCSVEVCGNYLGKVLPEKALMLLADFLRPIDQELGGALQVWLHQEVYATACPARIAEQRDTVVDMINNPDKWNAKLFPVEEPKPVVEVKIETKTVPIPFATVKIPDNTLLEGTEKVTQEGINGSTVTTTAVTYTDGKETARVQTGASNIPAVDKIIHVGTMTKDSEQDKRLNALEAIVKAIVDFLASIFSGFKKG